jgi:hypothetical protein
LKEPDSEPQQDESTAIPEKKVSRSEARKKEQEEIKQIMEEENIQDEEDKGQLTELDSLTGLPLADDVLLFAVPICGPYSAMQNFKYKVKLTPGGMKKGKGECFWMFDVHMLSGAKSAVDSFVRSNLATQQERELIKLVDDAEIMQQMLGNVKVHVQNKKPGNKKK